MHTYWILPLLFLAIGSQAQTFDTPLEYLNFLNKEFVVLQDLQIAHQTAMAYQDETAAEQQRQQVLKQANLIHARLKNVTPSPNDHDILKSYQRALVILRNMGQKDYEQLAIQKTGCTDCFPTMLQQVQLLQQDDAALQAKVDELRKTMRIFASENNIRLSINNTRNNLIDRMNQLNAYLQVYNLAVSEVQYANDVVVDALNARDIDAGQAAAAALLKASENAVKRLSTTSRLDNDGAYFTATRQLIDAYRKAGQYLYPTMLKRFDTEGNLPNDQVEAYNKNIEVLNTNLQNLTNTFFEAEQTLHQRTIPVPSE